MDNNIPTYYEGKYNTYIGARYVPVFDGEWSSTQSYEPLTIVTYQGASYTSKTFVPVGIDINNEDYWVLTGNYNAQVESYRQEVQSLKKSLPYIRFEDFGAKGDGTNDDTTYMQTAIDYAIANKCVITSDPSKIYLISASLNITGLLYMDLNWATIKTQSAINMIVVNDPNANPLLAWYGSVEKVNIDCGNIATTGLLITYGRKKNFDNIHISNVQNVGLSVQGGFESVYSNIHINGGNSTTAVAMVIAVNDCIFTDIITINFTTMCNYQGFNFLTRIHSWNSMLAINQNSVMFNTTGNGCIFGNDIYCDSYNTFINLNNWVGLFLNNFFVTYNDVSAAENYVIKGTDNQYTANTRIMSAYFNGTSAHHITFSEQPFLGYVNASACIINSTSGIDVGNKTINYATGVSAVQPPIINYSNKYINIYFKADYATLNSMDDTVVLTCSALIPQSYIAIPYSTTAYRSFTGIAYGYVDSQRRLHLIPDSTGALKTMAYFSLTV